MATNLSSPVGASVTGVLMNNEGNLILAYGSLANIPTGVGYAIGCDYRATDTGAHYYNVGTVLAASFIKTNGGTGVPTTIAAINATGTATAAQVATGYITSTSAAATTITLPTGTLLGAALGATQGTTFDVYVDNTAGANTVTIAPAVNGIVSSAGVSSAASFGLLTVTSGVTGIARFTIMFSSPTAYVFSRTA